MEIGWHPKETYDEFFENYAKRSNVSVESLMASGHQPRPCVCDYEDCTGWQMTRPDYRDYWLFQFYGVNQWL